MVRLHVTLTMRVYCEREGKGYKLYVAIADVSHYVRPNDVLDQEALNRGNSVYFPRRVIPMLPEALSNGLCSLNPEVERLCMVCEISIDIDGYFNSYRFYPAVMRSHVRFTYNQAAEIISNPKGEVAKQNANIVQHIQLLYKLYKVLLRARKRRGAIDFETIETQMIFNDLDKIEQILPVKRNDAHRLIEECMLAANVCASGFLQEHKQPTVYRIHEGPTLEKLDALRNFLKRIWLATRRRI